MTDDTRQQLDAAITDAREGIRRALAEHDQFNEHDPQGCPFTTGESDQCVTVTPALDRYAALVELRGRWDAHRAIDSILHYVGADHDKPLYGRLTDEHERNHARIVEIEADVRRLVAETP